MALTSEEAVYAAHRGMVERLCLAMLQDRSAAEDAVHDTFARALPHLGRVDDPPRYLASVARNVCRNEIARRRRQVKRDALLNASGSAAIGDAETWAVDRCALAAAWDQLNAEERRIAVATAEGYSLKEIAALVGASAAATAQRISRARRRLRRLAVLPLAPLLVLRQAVRRAVDRAACAGAERARTVAECAAAVGLTAASLAGAVAIPLSPEGPAAGGATARLPAAGGRALTSAVGSPAGDRSAAPGASASGVALRQQVAQAGTAGPTSGSSHTLPQGPLNMSAQDQAPPGFESFTPSPDYAEDHTLFASAAVGGCGTGAGCPLVLRSDDGGANWTTLASTGFNGGTLLLSPAYPRDTVLFAVDQPGASGLAGGMTVSRSDDGGRTFIPMSTSYGNFVVMNGASRAGDAQLVFAAAGSPQLLVYHAASRTTAPGPTLPPSAGWPTGLLSVSGAPDVFVNAGRYVYDCPVGGACSTPIPCVPQQSSSNAYCTLLAASPTFARDHLLLVNREDGIGLLHVPDGDWAALAPPDNRQAWWAGPPVLAPDYASSHRIVLLTTPNGGEGQIQSWQSIGGGSFSLVSTAGPDWSYTLAPAAWLPDGTIIVGVPGDAAHWGVACSADGGRSWKVGC